MDCTYYAEIETGIGDSILVVAPYLIENGDAILVTYEGLDLFSADIANIWFCPGPEMVKILTRLLGEAHPVKKIYSTKWEDDF